MKKRLLSLVLTAIVGFTALPVVANAATITKSIGDVMTDEEVEKSENFLAQNPDLAAQLNTNAGIKKPNSMINTASAAAALTSYYNYFVASNYNKDAGTISNYEYVNGESKTQNDFNGTVYVGTVEVGYGREYATFDGSSLNTYDIITLDFNNDRIVDGFIDVWKINNVTSGLFKSNCTSTNPNSSGRRPTYYTSLTIS